jgi:DNA-directed RNA polymerase specialized sigma24 family protein
MLRAIATHVQSRRGRLATPRDIQCSFRRRIAPAIERCTFKSESETPRNYVAADYSDAEISKLLGTSRSAIAVRLFRLRASLKKTLGGLGEGHERR